ncbi:(2Fe-2S)-binding protein [Candidatus Formimonas warabiya]|uniref:(2Fe-2S)-binding protein n=1 Tax=Formimonas warabiya TaxID=1761012 RepID=A0A3G1KQ82_FORW1|nr:(2Fe-2S)-binding protein [Candidatus Formimonas warabiya]
MSVKGGILVLIKFELNGRDVEAEVKSEMRLIDLLREVFDLTSVREGCGQGECGACTVILDEQAVNSCLVLAAQVNGCQVTTTEGLKNGAELDPIQKTFISEGAIQCGYCTPGMIMSAKALLSENKKPTLDDVKEALSGNLCRCTGYEKIFRAIHKVANQENE